jgi:hypothetical protein
MRTKKEIEDLRREAKSTLDAGRRQARLATLADRKAQSLQATLEALVHYRAAELGVGADDLSNEDVFTNDDERALNRLFMLWNMKAGMKPDISENESFDQVVARLALDRGWNMMDATRALLKHTDDESIDPRDSSSRGIVRRVRDAMTDALEAQLSRIEDHLRSLDHGRPIEKAGVLLLGALFFALVGKRIETDDDIELIREALHREQGRLADLLSRRRRVPRTRNR